jgi:hypothetical protein
MDTVGIGERVGIFLRLLHISIIVLPPFLGSNPPVVGRGGGTRSEKR